MSSAAALSWLSVYFIDLIDIPAAGYVGRLAHEQVYVYILIVIRITRHLLCLYLRDALDSLPYGDGYSLVLANRERYANLCLHYTC